MWWSLYLYKLTAILKTSKPSHRLPSLPPPIPAPAAMGTPYLDVMVPRKNILDDGFVLLLVY